MMSRSFRSQPQPRQWRTDEPFALLFSLYHDRPVRRLKRNDKHYKMAHRS